MFDMKRKSGRIRLMTLVVLLANSASTVAIISCNQAIVPSSDPDHRTSTDPVRPTPPVPPSDDYGDRSLVLASSEIRAPVEQITLGNGQATLSWEPVDGAAGYVVGYSTGSGWIWKDSNGAGFVCASATCSEYTIRGLSNGRHWFVIYSYQYVDNTRRFSSPSSSWSTRHVLGSSYKCYDGAGILSSDYTQTSSCRTDHLWQSSTLCGGISGAHSKAECAYRKLGFYSCTEIADVPMGGVFVDYTQANSMNYAYAACLKLKNDVIAHYSTTGSASSIGTARALQRSGGNAEVLWNVIKSAWQSSGSKPTFFAIDCRITGDTLRLVAVRTMINEIATATTGSGAAMVEKGVQPVHRRCIMPYNVLRNRPYASAITPRPLPLAYVPAPMVPVESTTYCPGDLTRSGLRCICTGGRERSGDSCSCPAGKTWNGSQCQTTCPVGQTWDGNQCTVQICSKSCPDGIKRYPCNTAAPSCPTCTKNCPDGSSQPYTCGTTAPSCPTCGKRCPNGDTLPYTCGTSEPSCPTCTKSCPGETITYTCGETEPKCTLVPCEYLGGALVPREECEKMRCRVKPWDC